MTSASAVQSAPPTHSRPSVSVICILAALVLLAYLPALTQPLIEDDYSNIIQARVYGPLSGWGEMFHDPVFRLRAISWVLLNGLYQSFGMHASGYYAISILLHLINTWLVYALGSWRALGYERAAWAAAFFAIYEGHQEAIMWISADAELLMLLFGLASLLAWIRFLEDRSTLSYAASLIAFCLALLSKESAVVFILLLALPLAFERARRRSFPYLLPFGGLALLAALSVGYTRSYSFRFQDGSFSLRAPFWLIWPDNMARMLWIWGLLSLVAIWLWRPSDYKRVVAIGACWMGIGLIPYSFLTYSLHIPSRQLYLASVGLSIIVGLALQTVHRRLWTHRRGVMIAVCTLIVSLNVIYLWTKKRSQFLERAAPTEQLIALARRTSGPIYIRCFPRPHLVAESAVQLAIGLRATDLVWTPEDASSRHATATFCFQGR